MTKEVLKLALEALEYHTAQTRPIHETNEAITAIKAALEAKDEPVGWASHGGLWIQDLYKNKENT